MGSVCCTSARAGDLTEAGDEGWPIERTGPLNVRTKHGALSPPPLSSHWERKSYVSEIASGRNCISHHRTSSCSRICRSNSNSNDNRANSSVDRPDRGGLLATFNSPSESLCCSHRSYDQGANPVAIPLEPVLRSAAAAAAAATSSEEGSGLSASSLSFSMASEQAPGASDSVLGSTHMQAFSKLGLSTSNTSVQSRHIIHHPPILESSSYEKMPLGLDFYQQMMRHSLDMSLGLSNKQKSSDSWKTRDSSELMESSSLPGISRWSTLGISSSSNVLFSDVNHEEAGEFYIRSTPSTHQNDPCKTASQVEAQRCGLCMKAIAQKSLWSVSRVVVGSRDMPVVGVLDCGHVYHAECLDQATPLARAHDPPCPKCEEQGRAGRRKKGQEEEAHGKMKTMMGRSSELSSVKWKLSKVGVSTGESDEVEEAGGSRSYQSEWDHGGISESFLKKGVWVPPSVTERMGAKSLLKKQFSFRGKLSREASGSNSGPKRPGYPARVSPEN